MKESKYEMSTDKEESKSTEGLDDDEMDIPRKHVRIEDVSPEAFGWILHNLAKPTLPTNQSILANILRICDKYMMESLNKDYLSLIRRSLFRDEKVTALSELFEALHKIALHKVVKSIIADFPRELGLKWLECFPKLSLEVALVTIESITEIEEEMIWMSSVRWAKQRGKEKKKDEKEEKKEKEESDESGENSSRKRKKPGDDDQPLPASKKQRVNDKKSSSVFGRFALICF